MAQVNMSEVKASVRQFNTKYGVNFSISEYKSAIDKAIKQARASSDNIDEIAIQHNVYKDTIKSLYRSVALNACKKLDAEFLPIEDIDGVGEDKNSRSSATISQRKEPILDGDYSFDGVNIRIDGMDEIEFNTNNTNQNEQKQRDDNRKMDEYYNLAYDEELFGEQLLKDFNNAFFIPYQKTKQGEFLLDNPYNEIESEEITQTIYDAVKDFKTNPITLYEELYTSGRIRIRDIRDYVQKNIITSVYSDDSMAKGFQLVQMLKNVNETRSFWWKMFHPFRNNAEQRDAAKLEADMTKLIIETNNMDNYEDSQLGDKLGNKEERNKALVERYKELAKTYTPLKDAFDDLEESLPHDDDFEEEKSVDEPLNKKEEIIENKEIIEQPQEESDYSYEEVISYLKDGDSKETIKNKITDFFQDALDDKVKSKDINSIGKNIYNLIVKATSENAGDIEKVSTAIFESVLSNLIHYDDSRREENKDGYLIPNEQALVDAQVITDKILEVSILSQSPKTLEAFKGYTINNNQQDIARRVEKNKEDIEQAAEQYNKKYNKVVNVKKESEVVGKERISIDLNENKEFKISQQVNEGRISNNVDKSFHQ